MKVTLYLPAQEAQILDINFELPERSINSKQFHIAAQVFNVVSPMVEIEDRGNNHVVFVVADSVEVNTLATKAVQALTHNPKEVWDENPVLGPCLIVER